MRSVLNTYGLNDFRLEKIENGLINNTWKVITPEKEFILQQINQNVFKNPADIAHNISLIANHLHHFHPDYRFISPLISKDGNEMVYLDGEYFRLFPFVTGSHSKEVVETPDQAYEAARQFGRFTRMLSCMDAANLNITIPHFHDLEFRYEQFLLSLKKGNNQRKNESGVFIEQLLQYSDIVTEYIRLKSNPEFKARVIHHDTKISNVLFDSADKGMCVIDLDTVMSGYFISDLGDMMRTYLSPVNEEEKDFTKIVVRNEFYKALVQGYLSEMKSELTDTEKKYLFYAGKFMIYMQAFRFLTDYINNDKYYGAAYPGQNFVRAGNQLMLLKKLQEKEDVLGTYNFILK